VTAAAASCGGGLGELSRGRQGQHKLLSRRYQQEKNVRLCYAAQQTEDHCPAQDTELLLRCPSRQGRGGQRGTALGSGRCPVRGCRPVLPGSQERLWQLEISFGKTPASLEGVASPWLHREVGISCPCPSGSGPSKCQGGCECSRCFCCCPHGWWHGQTPTAHLGDATSARRVPLGAEPGLGRAMEGHRERHRQREEQRCSGPQGRLDLPHFNSFRHLDKLD